MSETMNILLVTDRRELSDYFDLVVHKNLNAELDTVVNIQHALQEIEAGLDETSHMDDENMDEVSIELNESITNRFKKLAGILKS